MRPNMREALVVGASTSSFETRSSSAPQDEGGTLALRRPEGVSKGEEGIASKIEAARALIAQALAAHPGRVALVSSFGADAAALLHLTASVDPATPVIFVDTGRHFPETLAYVDQLERRLGLTDLRRVGPTSEEVAARDPESSRAGYDPDGCCDLRKVVPLDRALRGFDAWLSGRKRFQAATRAAIPATEETDGRIKYNPLADWTPADIEAYRRAENLPPHPLVKDGYLSIGCAPCTSPVRPGEDPRAGRWRGFGKTECGIHLSHAPATAEPIP